jgi:hypothetical protein
VEEALSVDGGWARREEKRGEARSRTAGLSLYIEDEGEAATGD